MAKRAQYKRKWVAAVQALRHDDYTTELSDSTDNELSDTSQDFSIVSNVSDDLTQVQSETDPQVWDKECCEKRARFNHDDDYNEQELAAIGLNVSEASDSEVDLEVGDDFLTNKLANWANNFQVKHNAIDGLLKILQECGHPNLPSAARTLLNTARSVPVHIRSGMQYIYFSFAKELIKNLSTVPLAYILTYAYIFDTRIIRVSNIYAYHILIGITRMYTYDHAYAILFTNMPFEQLAQILMGII